MKKIIFLTIIIATSVFSGCYDEKMQWGDPYTHPEAAALPLALQEQISRYEALTEYANDLKLGAGIDFAFYTNNESYRNLVNGNFNEITPGNEMKQQSLLKADGTLNFTTADAMVEALSSAGKTVFGHTLVWHTQQQASYFNGLIAPTIIPAPAGSNLIDGGFESGMGGWTAAYYSQNFTTVTSEAIEGSSSLEVIIPSDATGGKYDGHGQLTSPGFPIVDGHRYEISFFAKCSGSGQIAIDFPDGSLGNQYPWIAGSEYASIGTSWSQVVINPETTGAMLASADNASYTIRLLMASVPDVTYYIDNVVVTDLDAAPAEVNFVTNGNFETGDLTGWTANNGTITVDAAAAYTGSYGLKAISGSSASNAWDMQFVSDELALDDSKEYTFSFMVKSDVAGKGRISFPGNMNGNQYPWLDWLGTGSYSEAFTLAAGQWTQVSVPFTNTGNVKLSFDMGYLPDVTYYIDDVKVIADDGTAPPSTGPTVIEKTPEEKAAILEPLFINYIESVVKHFADTYPGKVRAWDVVNEALEENGNLRTGSEDLTSSGTFYWGYYLGKDYAVTAFKTARSADPTAKLFINDYNLESASGNKLQGLIDYVEYIESKGASIDGIGTQLHLSLSADTTAIVRMFQKLATTGKLIHVSEMDISVGTASPTDEQLQQQAELYRFVVSAFKKYIPASQQYSITVWGVSDNADEHEYWLPDDAPCLWNADHARKRAYKGFADGLAGYDVGATFPGTLQ
jgi:GH35 family endo-1,4-beta-xylanase